MGRARISEDPLGPEHADTIVIPFTITIPASGAHRLDGMSRLEPVAVAPASGWTDSVNPGPKPAILSVARLLGIATAKAQERPSLPDVPIAPTKDPKSVASGLDPGVPVILPDGATVPDDKSPTGELISPVQDLRPVAAAGR
jgi:hypothetical protein